jgi:hypothetical protein
LRLRFRAETIDVFTSILAFEQKAVEKRKTTNCSEDRAKKATVGKVIAEKETDQDTIRECKRECKRETTPIPEREETIHFLRERKQIKQFDRSV